LAHEALRVGDPAEREPASPAERIVVPGLHRAIVVVPKAGGRVVGREDRRRGVVRVKRAADVLERRFVDLVTPREQERAGPPEAASGSRRVPRGSTRRKPNGSAALTSTRSTSRASWRC
jgi:hypothetical protein